MSPSALGALCGSGAGDPSGRLALAGWEFAFRAHGSGMEFFARTWTGTQQLLVSFTLPDREDGGDVVCLNAYSAY